MVLRHQAWWPGACCALQLACLFASGVGLSCRTDDAQAFIQGSGTVHRTETAASVLRHSQRSTSMSSDGKLSRGMLGLQGHARLEVDLSEPYEASTIGDISPRILTDDAVEALRRSNEREEDEYPLDETTMSEAAAETLAASIGVALARITARLDVHLARVIQMKEKLLHAMGQSTGEGNKSRVFEGMMNETLEMAQQGSATVAVVLRSTLSSTEASLESAGQRDLAAIMEESLGWSLSRYDLLSQPAFLSARDHVAGLSQDAGYAAQRLSGLREALRAHRRQANALGHALDKQFQDIVAGVGAAVKASGLLPVAISRVDTAFQAVQESVAAIAWKLYLPAWELATGTGVATSDLGLTLDEPAAESVDEPFGGEIVTLESSPFKPASARPITRALDLVEEQVEALLNRTMVAREELQRALRDTDLGRPQSFEALVALALATVEPDWRAVGQALARTARNVTQCLETAGEHVLSSRLASLFGDALQNSHPLSHTLDEPSKLSASLELFLQQQDLLAESFFRTYHEFITGISHSSDRGSFSRTISLQRWRESVPQRASDNEDHSSYISDQAVHGLCMALGRHSGDQSRKEWQDQHFLRLDAAEQDEELEVNRRLVQRAQEMAFGSVRQAAAIAWKLHSAAWVLVSGIRKAAVGLIG